MSEYKKRYMDEIIARHLNFIGAIFLQGPKSCGKTTTCKQIAKSIIEMNDPEKIEDYKIIASMQPSLLLEGEKPLLIDEWQVETKLWNAVRIYVDKSNEMGLFLLTGSVTPVFDHTMHTGTGRIARLKMYTMSLFESGDSSGEVAISDLINKKFKLKKLIVSPQKELNEIAFLICRGGWPQIFKTKQLYQLDLAKVYLEALFEAEMNDFASIKKNNSLTRAILKSYARASSTTTMTATIIDDVKAKYPDISDKTIRRYIEALEKLFIIIDTDGWNPYIKSRTAIRTSPKRDFIDPSIATAVLNLTPQLLFNDMIFFGNLFESLVRRDLRVYVSYLGGYLNHYRDRHGLECDNVLIFDDAYALVEVKLGKNEIEIALKNIRSITKLLIEQKKKEPIFSMVITAFGMVSQTDDGILIVPIGCLKA